MTPGEFEKKMDELNPPPVAGIKEPQEIKLAVLNAERSAAIGVWFVVVPCFFIACVMMKYMFMINLGLVDTFMGMTADLNRNPGTRWIQPVMLMGLPLMAIILNALAIMHFRWNGHSQSLQITIKARWINIAILLISKCIVLIFLLYLISENFQHRPGH